LCQRQVVVFRPVFDIFKQDRKAGSVSLKGRSVRMTEFGLARIQAWYFAFEDFWRVRGIVCLVEYPEKTDRLEQRQAAGKTLSGLFCFG
jgi:hypothetical protein